MRTKLILINGKKVRCRALKVGEVIKKGDVRHDLSCEKGEYYETSCVGVTLSRTDKDFYRPLPAKKSKAAKPKKAKPGRVKAVKAWGDPSKVGKFIRFKMTLDAPPNFRPSWHWQEYRISPISTKGRGK